jgi:hypothetical protein
MSRKSSVIALAITIGAVFAAASFASDNRASQHGRPLTAFAVATAFTQVDVDGDGKLSVGDELVLQDDDYDRRGGTKIGTGTVTCVSVDPTAGNFDCQGSDVLPGGEIRESGRIVGGDPTHFHWAVTGGTGRYRGAGGQLDGTFVDPDLTQATIAFTLLDG